MLYVQSVCPEEETFGGARLVDMWSMYTVLCVHERKSTPDDICYQLRRLIRVRMHSHYEIMHDYLNPFLGENCIRFSGYSNVETLIFNVAKILLHAILYCTIYIKNNVDLPKIWIGIFL